VDCVLAYKRMSDQVVARMVVPVSLWDYVVIQYLLVVSQNGNLVAV
jgi:hypothetical protein